jgi:hypothetical protein
MSALSSDSNSFQNHKFTGQDVDGDTSDGNRAADVESLNAH